MTNKIDTQKIELKNIPNGEYQYSFSGYVFTITVNKIYAYEIRGQHRRFLTGKLICEFETLEGIRGIRTGYVQIEDGKIKA